jgi:hypothetical protein
MAVHRTRPLLALLAATALGGALLGPAGAAQAGPTPSGDRPAAARPLVDSARTGPARDLPRRDARGARTVERENPPLLVAGPAGPDGALQTTAPSAAVAATAAPGFAGLGVLDNAFAARYAPPDTNGDVGTTQYVQSVNSMFAVYDKASGVLLPGSPFFASDLFDSFGGAGSACADYDDGDPVVVHDLQADRWVLTQFQVSVQPYLECVAVSDTNDATGSYSVYAYDYGADFVDYPKVSTWGDSYVITYNVFRNSSFTGPEVCALDRAALVARTAQRPQRCVRQSTTYPSLLAADDDSGDATGAGYLAGLSGGRLVTWRFDPNWAGSAAAPLTGPTVVQVASFSPACNGGTCIPQKDVKQKLDSLADRLMNRFASRDIGGVRRFVVTHAVALPSTSRKPTATSGVRWYELRTTTAGGPLSLHQQGTYAPDSQLRWMSSGAIDRTGGIVVGYSASSSTSYPSIRAAGRGPQDTAGTLGTEVVLKAGAGSQSGQNLSRWGDYASMSPDPDGCRMWFTTEYLRGTGAFNWSTWISPVRLPTCT